MVSDVNRLMELFHRMQIDGFDISKPLLWGFYFINSERDRLSLLFEELKQYNYKLEAIKKSGSREWQLKVTKVDTLTPEKLHRRNVVFNELANHFSVKLYDGWDVEQVD